jgi:hypothetical protein
MKQKYYSLTQSHRSTEVLIGYKLSINIFQGWGVQSAIPIHILLAYNADEM